MNNTEMTVKDCMKSAWEALLKGDTQTRDAMCGLAKRAFDNGETEVSSDKVIPIYEITGEIEILT